MEINEKTSLLHEGLAYSVDKLVGPSDSSTSFREELSRYAGELLKAVPLFVPAGSAKVRIISYAASALLNGLDQAKSGDDFSTQAKDFALGSTKGLALKGTFDTLGTLNFGKVNSLVDRGLAPTFLAGKPLELSAKAMSFGISSRVLDSSLNRDSYIGADGDVSLSAGLSKTFSSAFNPTYLAMDLITFSGSALGIKALNKSFDGILDRSPLAQNMATGASFGLISGSLAEAQRQFQFDNHIDFAKIAVRGILSGAVNGLAAAPGGLYLNKIAAGSDTGPSSTKGNTTNLAADSMRLDGAAPSPPMVAAIPLATRSAFPLESVSLASGAAPQLVHSEFEPVPDKVPSASNTDKKLGAAGKPVVSEVVEKSDSGSAAKSNFEPSVSTYSNEKFTRIATVINSSAHTLVEEYTKPAEGALSGAKKYALEDASYFWQLKDGRILLETSSPQGKENHIWVPFGAKELSGSLTDRTSGTNNLYTFHEHNATETDNYGFRYDRLQLTSDPKLADKMEPSLADKLTISSPQLEEDWQSALRVLPGADGKPYEQTSISIQKRDIAGLTQEQLSTDTNFSSVTEPARRYKIMSAEQASKLDDRQLALKTGQITTADFDNYVASLRMSAQTVTVPESYAQRLDALRELRQTATLSVARFPELAEQINEARRILFTSNLRNTLLPEHTGQFFDRLPNRGIVPNTILLGDNPYQYTKGYYDADAFMNADRKIRFFQSGKMLQVFPQALRHEWSHLLDAQNPELASAFTSAIKIESFAGRAYGNKDEFENWAVNGGEMFLDTGPDYFLTLAQEAPLKTVLFAQALRRTLKNAPAGENLQSRNELLERLKFVDTEVLPGARKVLSEALGSSDPNRVMAGYEFVQTLLQGKTTKELALELVDLNELKSVADFRPTDSNYSREVSLRLLLRLNLMRQVDPASFAERATSYQHFFDQVRSANMTFILDPSLPQNKPILDTALQIANTKNQVTTKLLRDLFPAPLLETASLNSTNSTAANQAYNLYKRLHGDTVDFCNAALRIASAPQSPNAEKAAIYLLDRDSPYYVSKAVPAVETLIENNESPELSKVIVDWASEYVQEAESSSSDSFTMGRVLIFRELLLKLQRITTGEPPDERISKVLENMNGLVERAKADFETTLNGSDVAAQKKTTVFFNNLLAGGDKNILGLARVLLPASAFNNLLNSPDIGVAKNGLGLFEQLHIKS